MHGNKVKGPVGFRGKRNPPFKRGPHMAVVTRFSDLKPEASETLYRCRHGERVAKKRSRGSAPHISTRMGLGFGDRKPEIDLHHTVHEPADKDFLAVVRAWVRSDPGTRDVGVSLSCLFDRDPSQQGDTGCEAKRVVPQKAV